MTIRLFVLIVVLALPLGASAQTSGDPAIVFVCEHGAAKSVVAATYCNKIARERGLPFRATYRGTDPQADLSKTVLQGLREDGLEPPSDKPSAISQNDVTRATHVFAICCTLPAIAKASVKAADWSDVPDGRGYGPMRDAIVRHVRELLDQLQKR